MEWFNQVDATYRADLRELNELNYSRFEAKLEQRIAELRGEMQAGFAQLRTELQGGLAELRTDLARQSASLIKWMFVFWVGMVATIFVTRLL